VTASENSSVDGGFTVRRHGACINSLQIEIADTIRDDDQKRAFVIEDLAFAVVDVVSTPCSVLSSRPDAGGVEFPAGQGVRRDGTPRGTRRAHS
jgi:hypothetical protein